MLPRIFACLAALAALTVAAPLPTSAAPAAPAALAAPATPNRPWQPAPRDLQVPQERLDTPAISPDGQTVAFTALDGDDHWHIFVAPAEGGTPALLTPGPNDDRSPTFSSDGRTIAFVSDRGQSPDIFVMNADGTGQKMLTNNKWKDLRPALGPGGKIVFQSRRDAGTGLQEDIFVMTAPK